MNASLLIPALFFFAISLTILVYLVRVIVSSFGVDILSYLRPSKWYSKAERSGFERCEQHLRNAAEEIEKKQYLKAVESLRSAFFLQPLHNAQEIVPKLHTHHLKVLGNIVLLADAVSVRLERLGVLEDLLQARPLLISQRFECRSVKRRISRKHSPEGKGKWAVQEFDKKLVRLDDDLSTNASAIKKEIEKVCDTLTGSLNSGRDVVYH